MHSSQILSILAIAGSALALPQGFGGYWNHGDGQRAAYTMTETVTDYTTATAAATTAVASSAAPTTTAAPVVPTPTTSVVATSSAAVQQQQQGQGYYNPFGGNNNNNNNNQNQNSGFGNPFGGQGQASSTANAGSSQQTGTPVTGSNGAAPTVGGDTSSYMSVVNAWRTQMGLSQLTEDSTLVANDQKTVNDDQGTMTHELNPGTMAQVLAPGDENNFANVFVGGWLCELPDASGMNGICSTMSAGWAYNGETGHATILRNTAYSKIGCAFADGLWGCDLA